MPCTCAMTGCGSRWIAIISSLHVSKSSRASGSEQPVISARSWPAQNAGPSPRMITACTLVSAAVPANAAMRSRRSASESALRRSGRLSASVRTPAVSSMRSGAAETVAMTRGYRSREPLGVRAGPRGRVEAVADAVLRLDVGVRGTPVELLAQLAHADVDRAVASAVGHVPDPLLELVAIEHAAGLACKREQEPELDRGQLGVDASALGVQPVSYTHLR